MDETGIRRDLPRKPPPLPRWAIEPLSQSEYIDQRIEQIQLPGLQPRPVEKEPERISLATVGAAIFLFSTIVTALALHKNQEERAAREPLQPAVKPDPANAVQQQVIGEVIEER